jgi:hypothetical protein
MGNYLGPTQGFLIGVLLIVFRNKVAIYLEKIFIKFPKYRDGAKSLNYQYSVKPIYLVILGVIFILIAMGGFVSLQSS